jgi:uroporphyrinogen decarboxylase
MGKSECDWIVRSMTEGIRDRIPTGELCIDKAVIKQALSCERAGFEETYAFVSGMNMDIFTISPVYPDQMKRLPRPDECLWPDLEKWTTQTPLFIFALLDGPFEWGLRIFGFHDFLIMDKISPSALSGFIREVEELNQALILFLTGAGIDGIILADDIAYAKGLLMRPSVLREYLSPSLSRQAAVATPKGLPVFYHSDGNYREFIPDIIEAGFHGLHCLDTSSGMEITQVQHQVGNALCLWGHLDMADATQAGDANKLPDLVDSIRRLASGKRFILGTNSGLFKGMDLEGLRALYLSASSISEPQEHR